MHHSVETIGGLALALDFGREVLASLEANGLRNLNLIASLEIFLVSK